MPFKRLVGAVAVLLLPFASTLTAGGEPAVTGVARLGDRVREFDGKKYGLFAARYDPAIASRITNNRGVVWLVNGRRDAITFAQAGDPFPAGEPVGGLALFWLELPRGRSLEILLGEIESGDSAAAPEELRERLIERGFAPFTIEVERIPTLQVATMRALAQSLPKPAPPATPPATPLAKRRAGESVVAVKAIVRIGGRTKVIDGETYHLVGIRMDWTLALGVGDTIDVATVVNGQPGDRMTRNATPDERPPGKQLDGVLWIRLPEKGRLEFDYGLIPMPFREALHDPAVLKELLSRAGYAPFTIDVAKIPVAHPETTEELAKTLDHLAETAANPASGDDEGNK